MGNEIRFSQGGDGDTDDVWSVVCSACLCQSVPHLCTGKGFGGLSPIIGTAQFEYQENIVKSGQNRTEPQQQLLWTFIVFLWNNKVVPELQCQFFFPRQTLFPLSHSLYFFIYFSLFSSPPVACCLEVEEREEGSTVG